MALGIDDEEYYIHLTGTVNPQITWSTGHVGWSPQYGNNTVPYWQSTTYTVTDEPPFETGDADPDTCKHEWWEDTYTVLTTHPACYKQICKLCGSTRYRYEDMPVFSPRWKRVY